MDHATDTTEAPDAARPADSHRTVRARSRPTSHRATSAAPQYAAKLPAATAPATPLVSPSSAPIRGSCSPNP